MKSACRSLLVITLLLSVIPTPAAGSLNLQQPLAEPAQSKQTPEGDEVTLGVSLVNTFLTVRDHQGRLVSDLKAQDFTVLDDGQPQAITDFTRETQLPLRIALAIDRSRSVQQKFQFEQTAATQFLQSVLHAGKDEGLLIAFDSGVYQVHGFTDDAKALAGSIQKLTVSGGTSIYDAIYKTCRDKFANIRSGRKVLILVTDGQDTTSYATLKDAVQMALRTDVIVYAIGLKGIENGQSSLEQLTGMTGGRAFFPKSDEEKLAKLFDELQAELRNQYRIGYVSPHPPDGKLHSLTIKTNSKDLTVYARHYYASHAAR